MFIALGNKSHISSLCMHVVTVRKVLLVNAFIFFVFKIQNQNSTLIP